MPTREPHEVFEGHRQAESEGIKQVIPQKWQPKENKNNYINTR